MNIRSVLFPTDFSHYNDAALYYASSLAADSDAMLHIVHVQDTRDLNPAMGDASYLYAATWEQEYEEAKKRLRRVQPTSPGVQFEQHDLIGAPAEEIVAFAVKNKIDLVVMASHGRTGLSRLLMGSVAEAVMRRAPCPVLVVKQPAASAKELDEAPVEQTHLRMLK
jgi:nucleotide-binding universal stress UspA family protein